MIKVWYDASKNNVTMKSVVIFEQLVYTNALSVL